MALSRSSEAMKKTVNEFATSASNEAPGKRFPRRWWDWDATKKAEAADEKTTSALLEKVHIQEAAAKAETPVDVDASLRVAPGVFLPDGEGMFALEGKSIKKIEQAGSQVRADKKNILKTLSSIPIIPSKHYIELPGAKAPVRLSSQLPEFYLREATTDPEHDSTLLRTKRQGEGGPELALVHTIVKGDKRRLESIVAYLVSSSRRTSKKSRSSVGKSLRTYTDSR